MELLKQGSKILQQSITGHHLKVKEINHIFLDSLEYRTSHCMVPFKIEMIQTLKALQNKINILQWIKQLMMKLGLVFKIVESKCQSWPSITSTERWILSLQVARHPDLVLVAPSPMLNKIASNSALAVMSENQILRHIPKA